MHNVGKEKTEEIDTKYNNTHFALALINWNAKLG